MSGFDVAVWAWPQWFYAIVIGLNLILAACLHGDRKVASTHSFPITFVASGISFLVLLAGGFWA
jgi:hypothetical protein